MKSSVWQHPFVSVFKHVNLKSWKQAQKAGDVSEVYERSCGRQVWRIQGNTPAANYIQIPKDKKPLGLTGRFVYANLGLLQHKFFSMHFDFSVFNQKTNSQLSLRISLSNMYKTSIKATEDVLQIRVTPSDRWAIIVVDVGRLLEIHYKGQLCQHSLKSTTICANVSLRGIYTSDLLYTPDTLPKDMQYKITKTDVWENIYDWFFFPSGDKENTPQAPIKRDQFAKRPTRKAKVTKQEFEQLLEEEKANEAEAAIAVPQPVRETFQPSPIMALDRVIGYSGSFNSNVKWAPYGARFPAEFHEPTGHCLLYPSGTSIVAMNPSTKAQQILLGHSNDIICMSMSKTGSFLATGEQNESPLVLVWDLNSEAAPKRVVIDQFATLKYVSLSHDGSLLCTTGQDTHARFVIVVWQMDFPIKPMFKQICGYDIETIKFPPNNSTRLISCGRENIRFWRQKDQSLKSAAVVLNYNARACHFTDLDFEVFTNSAKCDIVSEHLNRVFVGSKSGMLFVVNYHNREIESVFQLHSDAIYSVVASAGFCITGGADMFLRVWPTDFSEFYIEAKHEASVTSVDISPDALFATCGTDNGCLGLVNIPTYSYKTIHRSHYGQILDMDMSPCNGNLVTISKDMTLRVWDMNSFEEICEFKCVEDQPISVSCHPLVNLFTIGFESGIIKIFDVETVSEACELSQHENAVAKIGHSLNGEWFFSMSTDSLVCLYNCLRTYTPVKTIFSEKTQNISAAFDPSGSVLAILGSDKVFVWRLADLDRPVELALPMPSPVALAFGAQGLVVANHNVNSKITWFEVEGNELRSTQEIFAFKNSRLTTLCTDHHNYTISAGGDNKIKIWNEDNLYQAFTSHTSPVTKIAFNGDCTTAISFSSGNEGLMVWSFADPIASLSDRLANFSEERKYEEEDN